MSRFEAKFQRGYNWPWARRWIVITFLVTTIAGLLTRPCKSQIHYACPTRNDHGFRCTCSEKPRGLDITCERLRLETINSSLQHLKKWNQAIFYLKLRNSNVPTLPDYFFQNLTVKHLIVIYTNLSSVGEKAFYGLDNHLESLDLSQNRLTKIPHPALKSLRSLLQLKVSHNNITFIHGGALDGLDNLLGLNLYGNGITGLDESALSGASKTLTRLNLGSNRFKSFPIDAFKKLNNLEALEMQENYIDDISKEDFFGLRQLDSINLAFNRIKELKRETFHHLPVLNSLDLGNNAIEEIDKDTFLGVGDTLQWLMLGGNQLNIFPSQSLKNLKKLRQLDLHSNNIAFLPEDAFDYIGGQLKFLSLQNNSISRIPQGALYNLHVLQWLHLHNNKLQNILQETFEPVLDTLTTLDVYGNPLICNCDLRWFREWMQKQDGKILRVIEKIQCQEPKNFRGRPILDIDPSHMTCPMTTQMVTTLTNNTATKLATTMANKTLSSVSSMAVQPLTFFHFLLLISTCIFYLFINLQVSSFA